MTSSIFFRYEIVSCKYAPFGCKEKLNCKDLRKHKENGRLHKPRLHQAFNPD